MAIMEYIPYDYGEITVAGNVYQPSTYKSFNNLEYIYWERTLFQRAASSMIYELTSDWEGKVKDFFKYIISRNGYVAVFEEATHGLIFQPCTLCGHDLYYQPTEIIVTNPALRESSRKTIGKDCELLKLTPDYRGIWDIVSYHAEQLAVLGGSLRVSAINSKVAYVLGAKTKSAAAALKSVSDKVNKGESTVIYDETIDGEMTGDDPFVIFDRRSVKESYLVDQILEDMRTIMNNFDCEIGIPVLPQEKKERMISAEANGRIIDGMSRAIMWEETFNSAAEIVNKKYGTDIRMELRYKELMEKMRKEMAGEDNEQSKTDNSGTVQQ